MLPKYFERLSGKKLFICGHILFKTPSTKWQITTGPQKPTYIRTDRAETVLFENWSFRYSNLFGFCVLRFWNF